MKIFREIANSISNKKYYQALPTSETLSSSIKYLAKLCLLVSLIIIIVLSFGIPKMTQSFKSAMSEAITNFPDDLTLSIQNGTASINRPEPYMVPMGESLKENAQKKDAPVHENIVVVDTTQPFSVEQFYNYSTVVWITKTEIVTSKDSTGEIKILPLSKFGDHEITKSWVETKENLLVKFLPLIMVGILLLMFVGIFISSFVGNLIMLFIYALAIWIMSKIKKVELSYKNSYKIGAHAVTLLVILKLFSMIHVLSILNNFFIKLIILIIIVYINFFTSPKISTKPAI